jgi:hypothetical protein
LDAIDAGKRCAATVYQKAIVFFLAAGAFNVFMHRHDVDALAGSLAGLAVLLALICGCGFGYGFLTSASPATPSVETSVAVAQPPEQQAGPASEGVGSDDPPLWAWLIAGSLFWFWKSGFSIAAMPDTAQNFLLDAFRGLTKLLGSS